MFGVFVPAMMEMTWVGGAPEVKWKPAEPTSKFGLKCIRKRIMRVIEIDLDAYKDFFKVNKITLESIETQDNSSRLKKRWLKKYIKRLIAFLKTMIYNLFDDKERTNKILIEYLTEYKAYLSKKR